MPRRSTSCPCWQSICLFFFLFCRNVIAAFVLPFSSSSSSSAINTCGRQAKSYRASQPPAVLVKCNVQSTAAVGIDRGAWLRRPRCLAPLSAVSDPVEQQQLKEIPHGVSALKKMAVRREEKGWISDIVSEQQSSALP